VPSVRSWGTLTHMFIAYFVQAEKAPAKKKLGASSRKKKKSKAEVGACFVMHSFMHRKSCSWRHVRAGCARCLSADMDRRADGPFVQFEIRCYLCSSRTPCCMSASRGEQAVPCVELFFCALQTYKIYIYKVLKQVHPVSATWACLPAAICL
jgi:hypothetical protein